MEKNGTNSVNIVANWPGSAASWLIRSGVAMNWCVTSSPAITSGPPYSNTTEAASGSAQMLNPATAVRFPNDPPPMSEIPAIRPARSGADRRARAMLVSGLIGTSQAPSRLRHV